MGRHSKLKPEFPAIAARMRTLGMSTEEICFALGISVTSYWTYRKTNKTFKKKTNAPRDFNKIRRSRRGAN